MPVNGLRLLCEDTMLAHYLVPIENKKEQFENVHKSSPVSARLQNDLFKWLFRNVLLFEENNSHARENCANWRNCEVCSQRSAETAPPCTALIIFFDFSWAVLSSYTPEHRLETLGSVKFSLTFSLLFGYLLVYLFTYLCTAIQFELTCPGYPLLLLSLYAFLPCRARNLSLCPQYPLQAGPITQKLLTECLK